MLRLDTVRSQIGFEVRTRFGQRIEGVFPHFEGRIEILSDGRHQVHLKMFTRSVEIPGKARYTGWMRGEEFFDAGRHPVVEFDSLPYWPETVENGGDIDGRLTLRGISHPEKLKVEKAECARPGYDCDVVSRGTVQRGRDLRIACAPERGAETVNLLLRVLALATVLLGSGCASLSHAERDRAEAIAVQARSAVVDCQRADRCAQDSPLRALAGRAFTESTPERPRHCATLRDEGEGALVARLNLLRSATRSIDLQTYIFDTDDSARLVIDELLAASRRGVKVRVLIDQLSAISDLQILGALSGAHQNFQLRVYNPTFGKARLNYFDYAGSVLCCFRRFNQRMHNKLLVIDDAIGVVGGRNYQDDYYDWDREYNFRDRDVLIAGPEARAMAANFDAFWRAHRSVPAERLNDVGRTLLREGVPILPPATFRRPERVQRVSAEANDNEFVTRSFVDTALPVASVRYVAENSNSLLPMIYRYSAVWGAHEGSLLMWALVLALWTGAVALFSRHLPAPVQARVLAVMGVVSVGFLAFLIFTSNPTRG
ncbi:hypothetical protein G6F65_014625 [Rhizopus arrhizus]|nr:hypothetical protein G6F65_014625 [Rhizopus arrhizus]